MFYIYGLYSTKDNIVRYIGYTSNLDNRISEHKRDVNRVRVKTYKKNSIAKVINSGYDIDYIILDSSFNRIIICELEKYYLSANKILVNGTLGGDGGYLTDESKLKLSLALKGQKRTLEQRATMSNKRKGIILSEETKRKMSETHKRLGTRIIITDEIRKKYSDRMKGKPSHMLGKKHSEETKKKISEAKKGVISKKRKEVLQICPITKEIIKIFPSLTLAQSETKINNIHRCINKKRKTAGNYEWEYNI